MECHYCESSADVVVAKDNVKVGVCEDHFHAQMEELADSEIVNDLEDQLDVDRAE